MVATPSDRGPLAPWLGSMARFAEGADHVRLRDLTTQVIASLDPVMLRESARWCAASTLSDAGEVDLVQLARRAPVEVLAAALGLGDVQPAVDAVDALVQATAPATGEVDRPDDESVDRLLREAFGPPGESTVARLSVLFQAMDATAALIVARLLGSEVPPILTTTRRTVQEVTMPSMTVPTGTGVVVGLGAATMSSDESFVFGAGRHRCPAEEVALALADGVIDAVHAWGGPVGHNPIEWQPRPNLRIPRAL